MEGFIKLDRKLLKWEWKDDPNTVALWIYILLQANWEDRRWHGQLFERGSFPTSIRKLAKETGLTVRQARTCLEHLISTHEITQESTQSGTKIIVNKWEEYQCSDGLSDTQNDKQSDTRPTQKRHTTDTPIRKKEEKERKEYLYKGYSDSFVEAMNAFKEMRKAIKKPLTERAEKMILDRLSELATNEYQQIEIINQSTINSWQNVYPLKVDSKRKDIVPEYDEASNPSFDEKRFEEIMKRRNKNVS